MNQQSVASKTSSEVRDEKNKVTLAKLSQEHYITHKLGLRETNDEDEDELTASDSTQNQYPSQDSSVSVCSWVFKVSDSRNVIREDREKVQINDSPIVATGHKKQVRFDLSSIKDSASQKLGASDPMEFKFSNSHSQPARLPMSQLTEEN